MIDVVNSCFDKLMCAIIAIRSNKLGERDRKCDEENWNMLASECDWAAMWNEICLRF